ncbi:PA0069 family radical SAM protein [Dongia soli]|uniref:PA0069 family radical SAM protein n=1 Tax=Dongia soli TaxID=600628 RepID=A0ABU5ECB2_9PROT|nr:PA0069 family radical SAM protein [Dongia soli]MDY0883937.1 PA0069 family radical SAM protein [Dongia soli]
MSAPQQSRPDFDFGDMTPAPETALPAQVRKGRGAISNRPGRYEPGDRPAEDDGWPRSEEEEALPPLRTVVGLDTSKTIISRNDSPDIPFDQSINPYRGCEHGCIYCFARPTHAYLGHSPGLDFETKLYHKPNAAKLLEKELRRPSYRPSLIALGANTDPYQPIERRYRLTRSILQVLSDFNHPVGITTKSANVLRDIDLLTNMARRRLVHVAISVTSLNADIARQLEPRASAPHRRLAAIKQLAAAGIPVSVSVAPIIPALTDHEIEAIIEAAVKNGARGVNWTLLRLPLEIKDLFKEWLEAHVPDRADHVLSLVKDCHGGQIYSSQWGSRMKGSGPYAEMIRQRVEQAAKRHGIGARDWRLDLSRFAVPQAIPAQPDLFSMIGESDSR